VLLPPSRALPLPPPASSNVPAHTARYRPYGRPLGHDPAIADRCRSHTVDPEPWCSIELSPPHSSPACHSSTKRFAWLASPLLRPGPVHNMCVRRRPVRPAVPVSRPSSDASNKQATPRNCGYLSTGAQMLSDVTRITEAPSTNRYQSVARKRRTISKSSPPFHLLVSKRPEQLFT